MSRGTKLFLLIMGATLLVPAGAQATRTFNPTSLTFQTPLGRESAGQTVTYSIDATEFTRSVSPSIQTAGGACTPPPNGGCVFRFTTTCPIFPAMLPPGNQSCTFTVFHKQDIPGKAEATLHSHVGQPFVTLTGSTTGGKKKKCKKKGSRGRSAAIAKKKCKKKKR